MMLDTFNDERLQQLQPDELSDSLERGSIVFFPAISGGLTRSGRS